MATVHIHIGRPDRPYDKRYGFRPEEPSIDELIECYVQKHFPKGYVIVETERMPPHHGHPYTNSKDWFEYSIYGPFKSKKDLLLVLDNPESRKSVRDGLVFKDGARWTRNLACPPPAFKVTAQAKVP